MCLSSCARLQRCRPRLTAPLMMISQRPCDHWVAASALAGATRSIWMRGIPAMTSSASGGPVTPDRRRRRSACASATRSASGVDRRRSGTRSRSRVIVLRIGGLPGAVADIVVSSRVVLLIDEGKVRLQLGHRIVGQLVLGPQVGPEAGQSVGIDEAGLGVEVRHLDVQRPGNLPQLAGGRSADQAVLEARHIGEVDFRSGGQAAHGQPSFQSKLLQVGPELGARFADRLDVCSSHYYPPFPINSLDQSNYTRNCCPYSTPSLPMETLT